MNPSRKLLYFFLVLLLQLAISDFLHLGPWVTLTLLPLLVALLPQAWSPHRVMAAAFILGLAVDFLTDGVLGLNAFAAVMAAGARRFLLRAKKYTFLLSLTAIFQAAFILLDCAGMRPVGFMLGRFAASTLASTLLCTVLSIPVKND
mgnify:CR=1 FL=1